jgi:hypothetical protein
MKATRILLFLSPLLLLVPPLVNVHENLGLTMLDGFYKGMLGRFPGNVLMAFLCYTYAHQLGREAWLWVCGSLIFPFFAPFVLAFMPAKYGSMADQQRRGVRRAVPARAATGAFEKRFPLLATYLATLPKSTGVEERIRARLSPVPVNFEFSAFVDPGSLEALLAGAGSRQLVVWTNPENGGLRVFGAGMVDATALDGVTTWLRQAAPQRKVAAAVHPPEGPTKFFEYYPSAD